ncbi:MAG: DNA recombination protein RmuC [Gammaproteobacteria bacterium]|nr:DNA recombination protein RmuC [Gammaproteobacteria bacterium]MBU1601946.1 DNA recombination protein RmuC [Gammaproteobacteria bacterium]MBU2432318.1 DNA recombination protein RmuC [Gammaproteobacteria bacterium]MBU2450289.1 DNA recombination protein RmuC [Gammaproteobacteria bacterium]
MSETMGLALIVGVMVVILLQVALLLRGNRRPDEEGFRAQQEAQEKGLMRLERELREELARGRREVAEEAFRDREERAQSSSLLGQTLSSQVVQFGAAQAERLEAFARELNRFSLGLDERFERLKIAVESRLTAIQADNANKLEEMRRTVDEKLHATLEQRLGESFKLVSERLEQVHRGLGEMQTLAAGVGDLKRVLTNVKTRGTWGEVQLLALLEQLLTAEQFGSNVATKPGSNERVDFAIRLPGKDDGAVVWLPIDAKYPIEDYQRLLEAQDRGDPAGVEEASRAIETRLKNEAKSIHEKYVAPPHTTDFALLYLPLEGLYAEALRRPGLAETLQRDWRVSLTGPTTLAAMLNSLQMGFRTLAIEQRSAEVWAVLGAVKTEFSKFGEALAHTKKKLDEASNSISKAETRTRQLTRRLKEVEALPVAEAEQLIGVADFDGEDE